VARREPFPPRAAAAPDHLSEREPA
jgi:hypothetical protein